MPLTVAPAASIASKSRSRVRDLWRVRGESHRDAGRDAHRAFAPDEAAPQVVAGLVGFEPTERAGRAVTEDHVEGEDVRGGHAGGEAVGTAGVGGDVPADRARGLRRRIRRVVQTGWRDGAAEVEVQHARLDPRDPVVGVDGHDPVQVGGDDDDGPPDRGGAAGEAGPAAAGDEGPVVAGCDRDRRGDLLGGRREAHRGGVSGGDAGVAAVQGELERLGPDSTRPEGGRQVGEQRTVVVDARSLPTLSIRSARRRRRTDAGAEPRVGHVR